MNLNTLAEKYYSVFAEIILLYVLKKPLLFYL